VSLLRLLLVTAVGTWLGAACLSSDSDTTVSDDDAGSTVQIDRDEPLVVELEGNPTTGYNWYVAVVDEAILRQVGETDFDPDSDAEGAAGTVTLRFEAVGPGTTALELVYRRENEPDDTANQSWRVTVVVSE
jgi:inhibitor of cysteine peptidase